MPCSIRTPTLDLASLEYGPGDGPAVVLLRGWPSDMHDWDGVAPPLAAAGYRVLDNCKWPCLIQNSDIGLVRAQTLAPGTRRD